MRSCTGLRASSSEYPNIFTAALFQKVARPSLSTMTMASYADWATVRTSPRSL